MPPSMRKGKGFILKGLHIREKGENQMLSEKYTLTITEAAKYFSIGEKKIRKLAEENLGKFAILNGRKYLIIREKLEQFLAQVSAI